MRETLGEDFPETLGPGIDDPIDLLSRRYDDLLRQKYSTEEELNRVESERAAAMRNAGAPFDTTIRELRSRIEEITEQQSLDTGRKELEKSLVNSTPLYRASLELLANKYWHEEAIGGLVGEIGREGKRHSPAGILAVIQDQLRGISALEGVLKESDEPQPLIVFGLHRYEELDEQAQWEGRNAHTGIFTTEVFGYSGIVTADSLMVEDESFLLPGQFGNIKRPAALVLHMSGVKVFQNQPDWTIDNFDREIAEDGTLKVRLLARKSKKDSPRMPMPIEWSPENVAPDKQLCVAVGREQIHVSTELLASKTGSRRVR